MLLLLHYPPSPMTIASASTIEIAHIIPPFSFSFTSSHPFPPPHAPSHLLTPPFCSIGLGMNLLLRADYVFLWGNELIMYSCGVLFFVTSLAALANDITISLSSTLFFSGSSLLSFFGAFVFRAFRGFCFQGLCSLLLSLLPSPPYAPPVLFLPLRPLPELLILRPLVEQLFFRIRFFFVIFEK